MSAVDQRETRYFVDEVGGLYRLAYNPAGYTEGYPSGYFDVATGTWKHDQSQTAYEHLMRGGYMTEITAEQAAGIKTFEDGLDVVKTRNAPYLTT